MNNKTEYKLFIQSLKRKEKAENILGEYGIKFKTDYQGFSWVIKIPEITYETMSAFNSRMGIDEEQMYVCYHE